MKCQDLKESAKIGRNVKDFLRTCCDNLALSGWSKYVKNGYRMIIEVEGNTFTPLRRWWRSRERPVGVTPFPSVVAPPRRLPVSFLCVISQNLAAIVIVMRRRLLVKSAAAVARPLQLASVPDEDQPSNLMSLLLSPSEQLSQHGRQERDSCS
jgi:hypothetical protein